MTDVFVLWHIAYADPEPGEVAHHRDDDGEVSIDEQAGNEGFVRLRDSDTSNDQPTEG